MHIFSFYSLIFSPLLWLLLLSFLPWEVLLTNICFVLDPSFSVALALNVLVSALLLFLFSCMLLLVPSCDPPHIILRLAVSFSCSVPWNFIFSWVAFSALILRMAMRFLSWKCHFVLCFLFLILCCHCKGKDSSLTTMKKKEKEVIYSVIQVFVGKWWNGSYLYPDPCGWTPIQVWSLQLSKQKDQLDNVYIIVCFLFLPESLPIFNGTVPSKTKAVFLFSALTTLNFEYFGLCAGSFLWAIWRWLLVCDYCKLWTSFWQLSHVQPWCQIPSTTVQSEAPKSSLTVKLLPFPYKKSC